MFVLPACLFVNTEVTASWLASLTLTTYPPAQPVFGACQTPLDHHQQTLCQGCCSPTETTSCRTGSSPTTQAEGRWSGNSQRNPPPCPTLVNLHHTTPLHVSRGSASHTGTNLAAQAWDSPQLHHRWGQGQDQEARSPTISRRIPLRPYTHRTRDPTPCPQPRGMNRKGSVSFSLLFDQKHTIHECKLVGRGLRDSLMAVT